MNNATILGLIHWLLGAGPQGELLLADLQSFVSATTFTDRYDATLKFLQDFKPLLGTFPGFTALQAIDEHTLKAHPAVGKNGVIIGLLLQNLPQILAFITQIVPLFGQPKPATP